MRNCLKIAIALAGGTIFSLSALAQQAGAKDVTKADELFLETASARTEGGPGGIWVSESPSNYQAGPITAVRVCDGTYIDSIQFQYGDSKWGHIYGGEGGDCSAGTWNLGPGEQIKAVRIRSGRLIDGIDFITNVGERSFGGTGGKTARMIESTNGGSLAFVEGASGTYVDRLKFVFGMPYYITDFQYDRNKIRDIIRSTSMSALDVQCIVNNSSSDQTTRVELARTISKSESYEFGLSTSWGVAYSAEFGSDVIGVTVGVEANLSQEFSQTEANSHEESDTITRSVDAVTKAGEVNVVTLQSKVADVDIDFTYNIAFFDGTNPNNVISKRGPFKGSYKGVRFSGTTPAFDTSRGYCPAGMEPVEVYEDVKTPVTYASVTNGRATIAYRQTSDGMWEETNVGETKGNFFFREESRNANTIKLVDINRGVLITLDLENNKVLHAANANATPSVIFNITGTR